MTGRPGWLPMHEALSADEFGRCGMCDKAAAFRSANGYEAPLESCAAHLARTVQTLAGPQQWPVETRSKFHLAPGAKPRT